MEKTLSDLFRKTVAPPVKVRQVTPDTVVAYGIRLQSRYGRCAQMIELLHFATAAANARVATFIRSAMYDKTGYGCCFELDDSVTPDSAVAAEILAIARASIKHFTWFEGEVFYNGRSVL